MAITYPDGGPGERGAGTARGTEGPQSPGAFPQARPTPRRATSHRLSEVTGSKEPSAPSTAVASGTRLRWRASDVIAPWVGAPGLAPPTQAQDLKPGDRPSSGTVRETCVLKQVCNHSPRDSGINLSQLNRLLIAARALDSCQLLRLPVTPPAPASSFHPTPNNSSLGVRCLQPSPAAQLPRTTLSKQPKVIASPLVSLLQKVARLLLQPGLSCTGNPNSSHFLKACHCAMGSETPH
ncbi:hypothetical protein LEMLEM_LOCUS3620 [Lemmus lemmus]